MAEPGRQIVAAGRLLVANPLLPDPNFDRTVVLLLACNADGAVGLVLNRPSETLVGAPLPRWAALAADPPVVFIGGPVQHQAVICLARCAHPSLGDRSEAWKPVTTDIGTLDLEADPDLVGTAFGGVRIFAGYAGWGPGQLEAEMDAGAWWVIDAEAGDAFCEHPGRLWETVLRRQGNNLVLVSYFPDDITAN